MKKILLCFVAATAMIANAQQFKVVSLQKLKPNTEMPTFHPRFMPDGKTLLVSSEAYNGLGLIDIETNNYTHITDMVGAGYKTAISEDGKTIIARDINISDQKMSLYKIDLKEKKISSVMENISHINNINFVNGDLSVNQRGFSQVRKITKKNSLLAPVKDVYVTEEDLKLVVYQGGVGRIVDPLSTETYDEQYCWSSISPNKEKLLFVGGNDAYVCNLDGSGLVNLGLIHAPVWRGDDYVVGMEDHDDGHKLTSSDIVIVKVDGSGKQKLAGEPGKLNMYPTVSEDGGKIAYCTVDGEIYVMTIEEK